MTASKVSIIGTAGVPAAYGGFETLAENLIRRASSRSLAKQFAVYCSGKKGPEDHFLEAELRHVRLSANGVSSIPYDMYSCFDSLLKGDKTLLLLGVSGALCIPFMRLIPKVRIITNIDGIEWRRQKWGGFARIVLRALEAIAVRCSHEIITDNQGISDYVQESYGRQTTLIAYGGDQATEGTKDQSVDLVGGQYTLGLCRIEPENNVEMILTAFSQSEDNVLVFVGNWNASSYGKQLKRQYAECQNITMMDPIYDVDRLYSIRSGASAYIHGHSAGGTNPSLVEMMHFGVPVYAFDCVYNRYTTDNSAIYFDSAKTLMNLFGKELDFSTPYFQQCGSSMLELANKFYRWDIVGDKYLRLLGLIDDDPL